MVWFAANPFPESAWSTSALQLLKQKPVYLTGNWRTRFSLPDPDPKAIERECRRVLEATKERSTNENDIRFEAASVFSAINKVQQLIGKLVPHRLPPSTAFLLDAVLTDAAPVTFALKEHFNRGRPYHCCDLPLDPMFPMPPPGAPDDPLYPGHPSYPSGHSTQAHLVAELYARMFPDLRVRLIEAARGVARRREIAGLHFATDSDAGATLAVALADEFLAVPALLNLFNKARLEWPILPAPGRVTAPPPKPKPKPKPKLHARKV